ncbi:MAG: hypothetical protein QXL94_08465 [Candidatus Parvarchaeum sp.]
MKKSEFIAKWNEAVQSDPKEKVIFQYRDKGRVYFNVGDAYSFDIYPPLYVAIGINVNGVEKWSSFQLRKIKDVFSLNSTKSFK